MIPLALAVVVILAVTAGIVIYRQRQSRGDADRPTADPRAASANFLLVILRRAPANLTQETLEAAAQAAWRKRFGTNENESDYVERGVPNVMYVLQAHGNAFALLATAKGGRTLPPPAKFLPDSASEFWHNHTHDLSVGLAYDYDTDPARLAAFVATLTAALCDPQSLAIYHPASRRLWKLDETIRSRLASGSHAFFNSPPAVAP